MVQNMYTYMHATRYLSLSLSLRVCKSGRPNMSNKCTWTSVAGQDGAGSMVRDGVLVVISMPHLFLPLCLSIPPRLHGIESWYALYVQSLILFREFPFHPTLRALHINTWAAVPIVE